MQEVMVSEAVEAQAVKNLLALVHVGTEMSPDGHFLPLL